MPLYPPASGGGGAAISAGTQSQNTGTVVFSNSNGVSFGLSNGVLTATVTPGAAAGIAAASAGTQLQTSGTLNFVNSNGVTIGMSGSSQLTFSHNGLTTAMASNAGSNFMGTNTAITANGVSMTGNSSGLSLNFPAFLTTARASTDAIGLNTALTANGVSMTANSSGLSLNFPAFLTTAMQSQSSSVFAKTGFTSTTTAGTAPTGTLNTNGLSMAFPNVLTTARVSNDAIGTNTALTANGVSMTANSSGLSLNFPAFLTTAALSQDSSKYAGTGTTFAANVSGSMTLNTAGLNLALSAGAGGGGGTLSLYAVGNTTGQSSSTTVSGSISYQGAGELSVGFSNGSIVMSANVDALTAFAQSNTTQSSTGTLAVSSLMFAGAGIASVGISNGSVVVSVPSGGGAGDGVNIISMLTSTSGGGTAGATFSTISGSIGMMAGSNITLSQTSNTIVFNAPNSSSLVGASGLSVSSAGSTISIYEAPQASYVAPSMEIAALSAFGNGSFSIRYQDVFDCVTATRVDMPFLWQQATTAAANTVGIAITVLCGIYTRNGQTLNSVSSASTQSTYTYASNSAGQTGLTGSAVRPVSIPMNVNMTPGAYYMGFGISTANTSIGTATTTAGQTISAMGVPSYSSAVGWVGDFTQATATSIGMFSGHGVYSAAVASVVPAISLSAINQSGSYFSRGNIALVFRNA